MILSFCQPWQEELYSTLFKEFTQIAICNFVLNNSTTARKQTHSYKQGTKTHHNIVKLTFNDNDWK